MSRIRYCILCLLLVFTAALQAQLESHTGVGLIFSLDSSRGYKLPRVDAVVPDAPAEAAGMQAGDVITAVNGVSLKDKSWDEDTKLIGGAAGTSVTLDIEGAGGVKQSFTMVRREYEYAKAFYNTEKVYDAFCVRITKLMNDAAYQFKHSRGTPDDMTNVHNGGRIDYKSYANIPDVVRTDIFFEDNNVIAEIIVDTASGKEAMAKMDKKVEEYIGKLKGCFPDYYYEKIKNEKEGPYTIVGKNYPDGYETPVLSLFTRKNKVGYEAVIRIPGNDKHRVTKLENEPANNDFAKAIRKIANSIPSKFADVRGTKHDADKNDPYSGDWYELSVTPTGAKDCKYDTRSFGDGCTCLFYDGVSAEEANTLFQNTCTKVKEALGKPYFYDTNKPMLSVTVPSTVIKVMNFGKKTRKDSENIPKVIVFLDKGKDGKYIVKMVFEESLM